MRNRILAFISLLPLCSQAEEGRPAPAYVDEAPLPAGWPKPGPYDKVTEKRYPAYRAAITQGGTETFTFWTLFAHIKRKHIPMTAPVEKSMSVQGKKLRQDSMAFLYQSDRIGTAGPDGGKVEVIDVPATQALSYTWQGLDSDENTAAAKAALDAALAARNATAKSFRMLGYNGPSTPRLKRTWELQALFK